MPQILIIAYGNPLRSDDGVAWRAAELLREKFSPDEIEILCLHQLAPELAEIVSQFPGVIFIDAASSPESDPGEICVKELGDDDLTDSANHFSHALSPLAVIRLAETLYRAKPRAFAVTVTGQNFDHGEALSPAAASALPQLVAGIEALVGHLNDDR